MPRHAQMVLKSLFEHYEYGSVTNYYSVLLLIGVLYSYFMAEIVILVAQYSILIILTVLILLMPIFVSFLIIFLKL